jgi:hypothetical protein
MNVSAMTVWGILRPAGFKMRKPTRKSGRMEATQKPRLEFALRYEHGTLKDWEKCNF